MATQSFSASQEVEDSRRAVQSLRKEKTRLQAGVPPPESCAGVSSMPRGTPVSSHSKKATPLRHSATKGATGRTTQRQRPGNNVSEDSRESTEMLQAQTRDHFLATPRPVLPKPEQVVNCFAERRANGISTKRPT